MSRALDTYPSNPEAESAEKVLVILRDGRKLLGIFRSYDQYGMYPS